jgi:hypothetical protein
MDNASSASSPGASITGIQHELGHESSSMRYYAAEVRNFGAANLMTNTSS